MRRAILATAVAIAGCGSTVIVLYPDASSDAGGDGATLPLDAGDGLDVDRDAWFSRFDAQFFEGHDPPIVGSYPPTGPGPCYQSGCGGIGQCDDFSGWCCSGEFKNGICRCGYTLGCLPPEMCCGLPDTYVPACGLTPGECDAQGGRSPWQKP